MQFSMHRWKHPATAFCLTYYNIHLHFVVEFCASCFMSGSGRAPRTHICGAADASYHSEHRCCADYSLQGIMTSVMHSASDRGQFHNRPSAGSAVWLQQDMPAPALIRRPLTRWISNLAFLRSLGSVTVYPCDTNNCFFLFFWSEPQGGDTIFGPAVSEHQLPDPLFSTLQCNGALLRSINRILGCFVKSGQLFPCNQLPSAQHSLQNEPYISPGH